MESSKFKTDCNSYLAKISNSFSEEIYYAIESLAHELREVWLNGNKVFICGNGGSAANAIHIANDFLYGAGACGLGDKISGIRVEALSSNSGVLTCIANDTGYENIYSYQLDVKANPNDLVIALSGSGNSPNIVKALIKAKEKKLKSFAILGFDGGKCLHEADRSLHFKVNDMQISEDLQLIAAHICMQWLSKNKIKKRFMN